jgi:hypothetical protein
MKNQARDKKVHYIKWLKPICQDDRNLFTKELAQSRNPGMITPEKIEFKQKVVLFYAAKGQFMAPWPAKLVLTHGDFRW